VGVLMQDGSDASRTFLDAMNRGKVFSCDVSRNKAKGGYEVKLTLARD
jgi:hypothetical protein